MIVYLLKFLACSGILLLFYHLVLQSDRLFKFNRVFLLAIVGLALLIPITTVRTNYIEIPVAPVPTYEAPNISDQAFLYMPQEEFIPEEVQTLTITTEQVLIAFYLLVTLSLLIRFGRNLYAINRLKKGSDIVKHSGISIVLRSDISTSFSFLNYMFTNKERYEQGNLPVEIIQHEELHIKQYHSMDIICIELFQCFFWFNPFIYFIRKAIKLNHEFLADAFVIGGNTSACNYQKILLDYTGKQLLSSPLFASNLNYGFTKKRLNMMVKNTNIWRARLKKVAALAIITLTFCTLGISNTVAQEVERKSIEFRVLVELDDIESHPKPASPSNGTVQYTYRPMTENPLMRYELNGRLVEVNMDDFSYEERVRVIEKHIPLEYLRKTDNAWKTIGISYKPEQSKKEVATKSKGAAKTQPALPQLTSTFQMNGNKPKFGVSGLQANNRIRFKNESGKLIEKKASELTESEKKTLLYPETETEWYRIAPPVRKLKQEHLDDFLSPSKYGVWLDEKRVENKVLENYKPEDIYHYSKSAILKNAKNYGKHTFQVNLTTVEHAKTKPYFQNGWVPFTPQWRFSIKRPDIFEGAPNIYGQAWVRPNSTVRYTNKAGELVENIFNAIEKSERKWLEHPDRKVEILLPAVEKSEFNQAVLDKYQDTKKYGVWVDDKKINNKELMNYPIDGFHHSRVYWLSKKSQTEKGHSYQILFYTDDGATKLPSANDRWIPVVVQYIVIQYIQAGNN